MGKSFLNLCFSEGGGMSADMLITKSTNRDQNLRSSFPFARSLFPLLSLNFPGRYNLGVCYKSLDQQWYGQHRINF